MHPLITAYLRWVRLFKLVVFHDRTDLDGEKTAAWQHFNELRSGF